MEHIKTEIPVNVQPLSSKMQSINENKKSYLNCSQSEYKTFP